MIQPLLQRAQILIDTKRPADAAKMVRQALAQDPNHGRALALLALCLLQQNAYGEALEAAQQAVKQEPENAWVLYILGFAYFLNGDKKTAREMADNALRLNPTDPRMYALMAQIEIAEGAWESGLQFAEKGLQHDPAYKDLLILRDDALISLDRLNEASAQVENTLNQHPESSRSHATRAWLQVQKREYEAAAESFLEALRLNPNNANAYAGFKLARRAKYPMYETLLFLHLRSKRITPRVHGIVLVVVLAWVGIVLFFLSLRPGLFPVIGGYLLFVFASVITIPLANASLLFHRDVEPPLDREERITGGFIGFCIPLALLLYCAGNIFSSNVLFLNGFVVGTLSLPVLRIFTMPEGSPARKTMIGYAILLAFCGLVLYNLGNYAGNRGLLLFGLIAYFSGLFVINPVARWLLSKKESKSGR